MNVGVLTASLPSGRTGGAEAQALMLATLLSRKHNVTVFTRSAAPAPLDAESGRCEFCRRTAVGVPGARFVADVFGTLLQIARRRKTLDALVAYQTVIDGLLAVLAKRLFGIPVIVSVRSEREYQLHRSLMARIFSPFVFRHADTVAVQTPTVKRELLNCLVQAGKRRLSETVERKLMVFPNGITLPDFRPSPGRVVLYVGRLIEAKGVRYLLDAMKDCPEQKLLVVGDGPERERLQARGLTNVEFAGRAAGEELAGYYRAARVLVLPSLRDEGMPNAVMEAMARGIPVIASRNAGTPDLVEDGETGFLVDPGDARAIARAIRRIADDDELRERLSRNCLREVERYQWPNVLPIMEEELRRLTRSASAVKETVGTLR